MNLIGRIFTLLIFLMSICFLVVAVMVGSSDRQWKKDTREANERAARAESILVDAKSDTNKIEKLLEMEKASRASQLAQLESQLKMARVDYENKEEQLRAQVGLADKLVTELKEAEARLAQQDREVVDLKAANNKLVEDIKTQFGLVRNLMNDSFTLKNRIRSLSEKESDLVDKLAKTQKVMIMNDLDENSNTDHIVPKRESVVIQTGTNGLFSIRLGLDDGIRIGHRMDVYRNGVSGAGARFVGTGEVIDVNDNMAVLKEIKDLMADSVREGDHVTSKF